MSHHVEVRVPLAAARPRRGRRLSRRARRGRGRERRARLPGASAALHELATGAPGRINALADNALYEAWLARRPQVTRSDVERAHADLGWVERGHGAHLARRTSPIQAERTNPMAFEVSDVSDPELDAVFEPRPRRAEADPELTAAPAAPRRAGERTRIDLDAAEPPPKADDVDEMFMELLDD